MYTDIFGKKRVRLGLHHHTALSDGSRTPEQVARIYGDAGYDAIALTDHWVYGEPRELEGLTVLSGAEYNIGGRDSSNGVYHIVALMCDREPDTSKGADDISAQELIDAIHVVNGIAVLAHPAWSLNTPQMIMALHDIDATEIYNNVSCKGMSRRADSSLIVDMLGNNGVFLPLLATDDSHYYSDKGFDDAPCAFIMAECDSLEPTALKKAIREGRFYASTGPEIHLKRIDENKVAVHCSPCSEVVFMSNVSWAKGRATVGDGIVYQEYELYPEEAYVRAYVTDKDGRTAWSNCLVL